MHLAKIADFLAVNLKNIQYMFDSNVPNFENPTKVQNQPTLLFFSGTFNDVFRLKKVVLVARSGSHRHPFGDRNGWVVVVVVLTVCCWWSLRNSSRQHCSDQILVVVMLQQ